MVGFQGESPADRRARWRAQLQRCSSHVQESQSARRRVSDGGQMTFPFLKVTKFPNDVLFFHRISLQHVSTENESWNEATEVEENLTFELKPNERLYLWQYKIGLGQEPVLFCRDIKIDDEPNPPTEVPLPPAK